MNSFSKRTKTNVWRLCILVVFISIGSMLELDAQQAVSGKITDPAGEPIAGANIYIKGTTTGTITDAGGMFTIAASMNDTLVCSFLGYLSESIIYTGQTQMDIVLVEDILQVDEVVVIGYGSVKKSDLTGAVTTVTADEIADRAVAGVDQALQGKAPGVEIVSNSGSPGSQLAIRIRGTGTINDADPIFVVDGLVMDPNSVRFINPADIENISVLKDASASAIYGARGANGVIMITTKKGHVGETQVSISTYYGIQSATHWIDMMGGYDYATVKNETQFLAPLYDPDTVITTNWIDEVTRKNVPIYNLNVAFSGGSEKATYMISGSYFKQDGVVYNTNYERYTLRINSDLNVKSWFKIGEAVQFTADNRNYILENDTYNSIISRSILADPITPVVDDSGHFVPMYTTGEGNPAARIKSNLLDQNSKNSRVSGSAFAEFSIMKGLSFKSTFGGELAISEYRQFIPIYGFTAGDANEDPDLNQNFRKDVSWQWENYFTYTKDISYHSITLLAGTSASSWKYYDLRAQNSLGPTNQDPTLEYYDMFSREGDIIGGSADQSSIYSWLGRLNYAFNDKYLLTASIRRDGSSKFGLGNRFGWFPSAALAWKIKNENFMQNIDFLSSLKLRVGWGQIGNEKIGTGRYLGLITNGLDYSDGDELLQGATALRPPNENIKWESTTSTNIGFDAGLFQNRILIVGEYFVRNTEDMLAEIELASISGIPANQAPTANIGAVRNKGLELSINVRKLEGRFQYDIGGYISRVVNRVTDLGGEDNIITTGTYGQGTGPLSVTKEGYPIGSFYGYVTDGIFQNWEEVNSHARQEDNTGPGDFRFKDLDGDGLITSNDQTFIGSPHPDLTYGFNFNLSYGPVDFLATFHGVKGGEIMVPWKSFTHDPLAGDRNMHVDLLNAWTEENPSNEIPRISPIDFNNNLRLSDYYIEDASFMRLKTLQIGYTLPPVVAQSFGIAHLRVYIGGQNLITFSDYIGNDPEIGLSQVRNAGDATRDYNGLEINIDYGNVPQPRVYTIGLDLTF